MRTSELIVKREEEKELKLCSNSRSNEAAELADVFRKDFYRNTLP